MNPSSPMLGWRIFRALAALALVPGAFLVVVLLFTVWMPGKSFMGKLPALPEAAMLLRDRLQAHVITLAVEIGERNLQHYEGLEKARRYIGEQLEAAGYSVDMQFYEHRGETFYNVEAVLPGRGAQAIVVGAHYDSVEGSPGANDNATGIASMLELARILRNESLDRTIRFAAFANEEPPYFGRLDGMGSMAYAEHIGASPASVAAMLSLETMGYYSDRPGSQAYPGGLSWLYPDRGNFIAMVANLQSWSLLRRLIRAFRRVATVPSEGAALPAFVPGVAFSDHLSFWRRDIPAVMITDTAFLRDPEYHSAGDDPERLDFDRMARVVQGLVAALHELASGD